MERAKPYKILLVLAVVVAGVICMLLPEKRALPVASMGGVVKSSQIQSDTSAEISSDTIHIE